MKSKRTEDLLAMLEEALPLRMYDDYFIIEDWGHNYGEDIVIETSFDSLTPELILKTLEEVVENFDIDEYVDLWAESRGMGGVPQRYSDLIHAGEEYLDMIKSWRDEAKDVLGNVMLRIDYLYRDAANFKQWNTAFTKGYLSEEQINQILSTLDENLYFIPSMVGLPENRISGEPDYELDHIWFELEKTGFSYEKPANQIITCSSAELLDEFKKASNEGWHDHELLTKFI